MGIRESDFDRLMTTESNTRVFIAFFVGVCVAGVRCEPASASPPRSCQYGMNLDSVARDHRLAWSAAFDGRPLDDAELLALADAQALLDCLAAENP